ncbi:MAG: glyoxalase [Elusimicrobia bacterium GWF2_52_66]|nr:MAG: glyoxalase [Elusimicrobia bacterium GWA2_51_34]OGR86886.1 MAG: glyoxalase [Elusimicrobia bacterium GWF2_52_66]HAF95677.1 glyoxalase [Elusimicrobiota bacterium]HCE97416.1 glyoxalase [Elusimicrobiota bacterium]
MKFCWCTLAVKNLEESVKFYQYIIGLPVSRRFKAGEGMEICFLGEGETKVELICGPKHSATCQGEGVSLGFEVKSVDETIKFIMGKGLKVHSGPFQPNPHIKFFHIKDPDGYKVQFVENI